MSDTDDHTGTRSSRRRQIDNESDETYWYDTLPITRSSRKSSIHDNEFSAIGSTTEEVQPDIASGALLSDKRLARL